MSYIRMLIALLLTAVLIVQINKKRERIVLFALGYYSIRVLLDTFSVTGVLEFANAFGYSYQLSDILIFVALGLLVLDLFGNSTIRLTSNNLCLLIFSLMCVIGLLRGVFEFGVNAETIGDFRSIFTFLLSCILFARSFKINYLYKYQKTIDITMVSIVILSVVIWTLDIVFGFHPLFSQLQATWSDGGSTMRFVHAQDVVGLAIYSLYLVRNDVQIKKCLGIKSMVFVIVTLLFQHRTVWLGLLCGMVIIFTQEFFFKKTSKKLFIQLVGVLGCVVLLLIFANGDIVNNVRDSYKLVLNIFSGGSFENSTANTRIQVWNATIGDISGIYSIIGRPFGYGYATSIGWQTSPHSGYVRFFARTGLIGFIPFLILVFLLIVTSIKRRIVFIPEMLMCIFVFTYGYDYTWMYGIIMGVSINILNQKEIISELKLKKQKYVWEEKQQ